MLAGFRFLSCSFSLIPSVCCFLGEERKRGGSKTNSNNTLLLLILALNTIAMLLFGGYLIYATSSKTARSEL